MLDTNFGGNEDKMIFPLFIEETVKFENKNLFIFAEENNDNFSDINADDNFNRIEFYSLTGNMVEFIYNSMLQRFNKSNTNNITLLFDYIDLSTFKTKHLEMLQEILDRGVSAGYIIIYLHRDTIDSCPVKIPSHFNTYAVKGTGVKIIR